LGVGDYERYSDTVHYNISGQARTFVAIRGSRNRWQDRGAAMGGAWTPEASCERVVRSVERFVVNIALK
jgi:hypothetical protein